MLKIEGKLNEIEKVIPWNKLCNLVHVDYYKKHLISKDEIFKIEIDVDDCDDDDQDFEDDGQPDEYTEWQDLHGGDDWDHGQYDNDY